MIFKISYNKPAYSKNKILGFFFSVKEVEVMLSFDLIYFT